MKYGSVKAVPKGGSASTGIRPCKRSRQRIPKQNVDPVLPDPTVGADSEPDTGGARANGKPIS